MTATRRSGWIARVAGLAFAASAVGVIVVSAPARLLGQAPPAAPQVTFTKDIAPILAAQLSELPPARLGGADVAPHLRGCAALRPSMKQRTALAQQAGRDAAVVHREDIGIQQYKDDISLSDDEIAKIATWADSGAPRGNPADMPPPLKFADASDMAIGTPDLIVSTPSVHVKAISPDWWGTPEGRLDLTEDRYVAAVEIKELNDSRGKPAPRNGRRTLHLPSRADGHRSAVADRHAAARIGGLARARSRPERRHLRPGCRQTDEGGFAGRFPERPHARQRQGHDGHLEVAFKFQPKGYQPKVIERLMPIGTGDIDIRADGSEPEDRGVHDASAADEGDRLRTAHARGGGADVSRRHLRIAHRNAHLLGIRPQLGAAYQYEDDAAPLLPRGTILQVTGYFDNTPANRNVVDPRNWSGLGHRSIDNMNILIMQGVTLTDDKFAEESHGAAREAAPHWRSDAIGCPLCSLDSCRRRCGGAAPRRTVVMMAAHRARLSVAAIAVAIVLSRPRPRQLPVASLELSAGLRRLAAERRRVVQPGVRLHESQLGRNIHVPVGADNSIEPGGPDRGQPTTFFPVATASCSRSTCRRISVRRNWSGR